MKRIYFLMIFIFGAVPRIYGAIPEVGGDSALVNQDKMYTAGEIVVTATRAGKSMMDIPAAVSAMEQGEIQDAQKTIGLDETLSVLPGVLAQNRHNFSLDTRLAIRGFGSRASFGVRGITVLVDGIPETLPDGQTAIDNIDLYSTERIEVLRGPASSLYGNAAGGVIQFFTERNEGRPYISITPLALGSFGFRQSAIKSAGQAGRVNYTLSFRRFSLDGFREYSRAEQSIMNGRISTPLTERNLLSVYLNYTDAPVAQSPGALTAGQAASNPRQAIPRNVNSHSGESVRQGKAGIAIESRYGRHNFSNTIFGVSRGLDSNLPFAVIDLKRSAAGYRGIYSHTAPLGKYLNRLTIGLDLQFQDDERRNWNNENGHAGDEVLLDQDESVFSAGTFMQNELTINDYLEISGALRYDNIRFRAGDHLTSDGNDSGTRSLRAYSPRLAVMFHPFGSRRLSVFGNYSTSFETPTTTELTNRPDGGGGFNPEIEPQHARSMEAGIKGTTSGYLRYMISGYIINVSDELISFRVPDAPERDFYRNAGKSIHRGGEAEIEFIPNERFNAYLSYTYAEVLFEDYATETGDFGDNQVPGIPGNMFALKLRGQTGNGVYGSVLCRYSGSYYADDANSAQNASYSSVTISFGYSHSIRGLVINPYIGIENLFDRKYNESVVVNAVGGRYFEPAPGRNAYGGVAVRYQME